jgi:hypothetical protein
MTVELKNNVNGIVDPSAHVFTIRPETDDPPVEANRAAAAVFTCRNCFRAGLSISPRRRLSAAADCAGQYDTMKVVIQLAACRPLLAGVKLRAPTPSVLA